MGDNIFVLQNFFEEGISKGFSLNILKQKLLEKGWSKKDVDEASKKFIPNMGESKNTIKNNLEENTLSQKIIKTKIPISLKICSIIYYIQTILLILIPLSIIFLGVQSFGVGGSFMTGPIAIFIFIAIIPFVLLFFFIAKGLNKRKKWTKVVGIVFSLGGFIVGILQLTKEIYPDAISLLLINIFILWTLLFNKKVKESFRNKK